ncbi:MAG TPA: hypothetical protein VGP99_04150 [Tepidisphaeraceae bacterium]|jgi:short subunit fatty acids transporter|nr:hypothetical protein [Tepidisphaeraceae bacterium]
MKARLLQVLCWMMALLLSPAMALAADDEKLPDARIQNFTKVVTVPEGGTALTWLLLIFLSVICLAALFKNAKRTHLD